MDVFVPILIFVLVFILFSICGFCCKRKREGTVYGMHGTTVTVSTQPISATPVVQPPYPVEARHPTPHSGPPPSGFATHNPPYPTHTPHPVPGAAPYPPMATPYPPAAAPYPPAGGSAPYPDYSANPPSYSEAVGQPVVHPPPNINEGYTKQSPYNPNY